MKKTLAIVFILFLTNKTISQELNLPVFSQYLADNPFVVSPTFAGIGDNLRIRANGLTQWVGIKNAPQNTSLYADMRLGNRSGIGITLYSDKNGATRQNGVKFSFAQHIMLDEYSKQFLSFGISYNINNFRIETGDFTPSILDPIVTTDRFVSNNNFDLGFLYRLGGFYTSFNANNILAKPIKNFRGIEPALLLNYQVYSGYVFRTDSRVEWEPSAYFQYFQSDKRSTTDLNIKVRKFDSQDNYYWAGLSARFLNDQSFKPTQIGPMVGLKKANFYFGYSYLATLNELSGFNSGTHVVTLGLDFFQGISNCPCTQYLSREP
jgi:type IX secretion system PorP/SprF family membrane protein